MMLAAISAISISAHAQDDLSKNWSFSGFLDVYYQYDFNKGPTGNSLFGRQFDVANNSFTLANLQFNAVRKTSETSPWGFTLNFSAGKNADILNAGEPAGPNSAFKNIQQAYVTYASPAGYTVEFGKFLTWIGYEGVASQDQDNYSRSFLFFFAQPVYHVGLRASRSFGPLNASVYLVNGWNEAEDSNAGKSYGASASTTFGKTFVALNYYGGNEGSSRINGFFAAPAGQTNVNLLDLVVVHQLTDKFKLALNADYASAKGLDAGDPGGKFYGAAVYAKYALSDKTAIGLRYDSVKDPDGLRSGNAGAGFSSLTGTFDYNVDASGLLRFEIRNDRANYNAFAEKNGLFKDQRTTFSLSYVFKF